MTTQSGRRTPAAPGLRFDKVALRLIQRVQDALDEILPDGLSVVFTIDAPIKQPSKTIAGLIDAIGMLLSGNRGPSEHALTIHGNRVRMRVVASGTTCRPRVAGFVHNPDVPPSDLLDRAQSLLERRGL